ncbi:metallophosphoesterase [Lujinxingia vulgaris]|uniref:Metallophosphoesterase n=1 Tax=Lujinxingia vulgaris TaxID=2600176 RepID=A0A5C6X9F3_9DELT|nr:metallophosphoesterase [Lujinxingia vulgaris]TXD34651.1 metallophosphoesterase [Lujinxingia vulgaris]
MVTMIVFGLFFTSLWFGAHYYLWRRLRAPLHPDSRWRKVVSWAVVGHIVLVTATMSVRSMPRVEPLYTVAHWTSYVAMGFFSLVLILMIFKDLAEWVTRRVSALSARGDASGGGAPGELADPSRRLFMSSSLNAAVVGGAAVASKWGMYEALRVPDVVEVGVPFEELPASLEGFRIVQISDVHVGPTVRRGHVQAIVDRVHELKPDAIVITGDLIEGMVERIWHDVEPIFDLRAPHGVFYCTGNHEYYWDAPGWCKALEEQGIVVLNNAHALVEHQGGRVLMAGCTDFSASRHDPESASDPQAARDGAPEHDVSVLLAHQPKSIHQAAAAGYDLQLSGHTHGGQMWPWNLIIGWFHPYAVGLAREDKTWIYVSRGTCYWGPPMRIGAPAEITQVELLAGTPDRAYRRRRRDRA